MCSNEDRVKGPPTKVSASQERLYFLIQRAAHVLKTQADAKLKRVAGVTTAQGAMITILLQDGPSTQRQIADTLRQRESAVAAMSERLIKAGYIARRRCEDDRRAWILEVTAEGRAAHDAMRAPFAEINAVLDDVFVPRNAALLAKGLRSLLERLDDE